MSAFAWYNAAAAAIIAAAGGGPTVIETVGNAVGIATINGVSAKIANVTASSDGIGAANGVSAAIVAVVGNAAGIGSAFGVSASVGSMVGSAVGVGVAAGASNAIKSTVGNAVGTATVVGISISVNIVYVPAGSDPLANGNDFQAAIDAAVIGVTTHIRLDPFELAGHVYRGNFTLPDKGVGTDYIIIESTAIDLIPEGEEIIEANAPHCARLEADNPEAVFLLENSAHHWHLRGLDITTPSDMLLAGETVGMLIRFVDAVLETTPHDILYDRLLVHPRETGLTEYFRTAARGIEISGIDMEVRDCAIYGFGDWFAPLVGGVYATWLVAATAANPCVVTLSGSGNTFPDPGTDSNHKQTISFRGATGAWTSLNGTFVGTWIDNTHVSLETFDPVTFARSNFNTTGFGALTGTVLRLLHTPLDSLAVGCVQGPGPITVLRSRLEAYVFPILFGGGSKTTVDAQNVTTVEAVTSIGELTLAGTVGDLAVDDLIAFEIAVPQTVFAASAANPCVLTVAAHRFPIGHRIGSSNTNAALKIAGATGVWADLADPHCGRVISSTQIEVYNGDNSIPFDTTGRGALTGTVTYYPQSGIGGESWQVGKVTAVNPVTRVVQFDYAGAPIGPSGPSNGAGVPIAVGCIAQHNGLSIGPATFTRCTIGPRKEWIQLLRDRANTMTGSFVHEANPKGCFEFKTGVDITIEGCRLGVIGGSLNPRPPYGIIGNNQVNQTGAWPWSALNDHIYRNNLCNGTIFIGTGHVDTAYTGQHSSGLLIENNLFTQRPTLSELARWFSGNMLQNAILRHNTVMNDYYIIQLIDPQVNVRWYDNIFSYGLYGYLDYTGEVWDPANADNNYIIDNQAVGFAHGVGTMYENDVYVASDVAMLFEDFAGAEAGGDYHGYRLLPGSPGYHAATDGSDVGVDFTALDLALGIEPAAPCATSTFDGSESPLSEGGVWTNAVGAGLAKVAGAVSPIAVFNHSFAGYTGRAWNDDQSSEIIIINVTNVYSSACVRMSALGTAIQGYAFTAIENIKFRLNRMVSGALEGAILQEYLIAPAPGDVIKLSVVGNVLTPILNGVPLTPVTDSTYATGVPGIHAYRFLATDVIDSWEGCDVTAGGAGETVGSCVGNSTVNGIGAARATVNGNAAGTASVNGISATRFTTVGNAVGIATVNGISTSRATTVGNAAGVATVNGISDATTPVNTVGNAAGVATVNGVGSDGSVTIPPGSADNGFVPVRYVTGQTANVVPVLTVAAGGIDIVPVREFVGPANVVPVREVTTETPRVKVVKV